MEITRDVVTRVYLAFSEQAQCLALQAAAFPSDFSLEELIDAINEPIDMDLLHSRSIDDEREIVIKGRICWEWDSADDDDDDCCRSSDSSEQAKCDSKLDASASASASDSDDSHSQQGQWKSAWD